MTWFNWILIAAIFIVGVIIITSLIAMVDDIESLKEDIRWMEYEMEKMRNGGSK